MLVVPAERGVQAARPDLRVRVERVRPLADVEAQRLERVELVLGQREHARVRVLRRARGLRVRLKVICRANQPLPEKQTAPERTRREEDQARAAVDDARHRAARERRVAVRDRLVDAEVVPRGARLRDGHVRERALHVRAVDAAERDGPVRLLRVRRVEHPQHLLADPALCVQAVDHGRDRALVGAGERAWWRGGLAGRAGGRVRRTCG